MKNNKNIDKFIPIAFIILLIIIVMIFEMYL